MTDKQVAQILKALWAIQKELALANDLTIDALPYGTIAQNHKADYWHEEADERRTP